MSWKILNLAPTFRDAGPEGRDLLEAAGCPVRETGRVCPLSAADLLTELAAVDAVVAGADDYSAALLAASETSGLKMIQRWGVGYDAVDIEAATAAGIVVGYLPGFLDDTVADYTWALLLGAARRIPWGQDTMRAGDWHVTWGHDVVERTLGIIGCGRIGTAVAERAKGFRMRLLGVDPFPSDAARAAGVEFVSLDELLAQSDFVCLNAAATPENRGLIGEAQLRQMKSSAYLINTARGTLLDEGAMVKALHEGWIAGAALDCFSEEPLPADHPLRQAPNALLCPHMAPYVWGNAREMNRAAAQNVLDLMNGQRPSLVVNPEVFDSANLRAPLA